MGNKHKTSKKRLRVRFSINSLDAFLSSPEKTFVVIVIFFGVLASIVMPIFMVPDEISHFYRAYQVGDGVLISESRANEQGGTVPRITSIHAGSGGTEQLIPYEDYFKEISTPDEFVPFPGTANYSPLGYIPQAVGIDIARQVNRSFGAMVIFGRITNLMLYTLLIFLAIKLATRGKWVYVVVGLFPVAIQQAASLSVDGLTIGVSFIFIALVMRFIESAKKLHKPQLTSLIMLSGALGVTKQIGVVLLLILLSMPKRLFGSSRRKFIFLGLAITVGVLMFSIWSIVQSYSAPSELVVEGVSGVDPSGQIRYIINHPLVFVSVLKNAYVFDGFGTLTSSDFYLVSAVGYFSWLTYKLPLVLIFISYTTLILALLKTEREKNLPTRLENSIFSLTFIAYLVGIVAGLYLTWTQVGSTQVAGIQGRYFLPAVPLLIPLFSTLSKFVSLRFDKEQRMGQIVLIVASVNLTTMLVLTYKWFN